jgi:hypothetical protein
MQTGVGAATSEADPEPPASRPSVTDSHGRLFRASTAYLIAGVVLFVVYLRLSMTYGLNSDSANILLMGQDMLHGNLLMHGWFDSDVSFYSTELPQYALLTGIFGLHAQTAHIAAAMTYTLTFLLAVMLARAGFTGRAALVRTLIAAAIMLAPQLGSGVFALVLSVGHIGTSVPLLLVWLLLDRVERTGARRWWVPAVTAVILAWVLVADPIVLIMGVAPLALAAAVRFAQGVLNGAGPWPARVRAQWYPLSLGVAAGAGYVLAWGAEHVLQAAGAYHISALPFYITPLHDLHGNLPAAWKILQIFGADFAGLTGVQLVLAILHLVSVLVVLAAVVVAAWRFLRGLGLTEQVLVAAIVANVILFMLTNASQLAAHEVAIIVPFGGVLAARVLPTLRVPRPASVAAVATGATVLVGYTAGLGWEAAQPSQPMQNVRLATFLEAHHLRYGLSGYWTSSSVTVDSGGKVAVRALMLRTLKRDLWMSDVGWYVPSKHYANFIVLDSQPGYFTHWEPAALVKKYFGVPAKVYHTGPYTVEVWDRNLLSKVP